MTSNEFDLSIIVCTRNRAHFLGEGLDHFARMANGGRWELIFVDNGSSDNTANLLQEFAKSQEIVVRVLHEPVPGLSRARNLGWRSARADVIAFTDDDCYPQPDFPYRVLSAFERDADYGFIGGRVLLWDKTDLPITIKTNRSFIEIPKCSFVETGTIHGANMAFRKEYLDLVGGFDELLGAGAVIPAAEDVDVICAVSSHGGSGCYDPEVIVFHHHRRKDNDAEANLMKQYDIGRGAFYMKCLLDHRRRLLVAKHIYWGFSGRGQGRRFAIKKIVRIARELRGAALFLFYKIFQNIR